MSEEANDFDSLLFKSFTLIGEVLEDQRICFLKVERDVVKLKIGYLLFNKKEIGKYSIHFLLFLGLVWSRTLDSLFLSLFVCFFSFFPSFPYFLAHFVFGFRS